MSIRYFTSVAFFIVSISLLIFMPGQAQTDSTCPALVEQALTALGENCGGLDRNSACYGYNHVEATFSQIVADNFFTQPADRAQLAAFETIQTAPFDLGSEEWGIAVLNVQANVPDSVPGQAVTMLLMGDVVAENAVDSASGPVTVITQATADLRSEPDAAATVVSALPSGTVIDATQISPDLGWLFVAYQGVSGWISVATINVTDQVFNLPTTGGETPAQTPMQAFYFRTGLGAPTCNEAPSVLAVQSPEGITVDLSVNGANIHMGSLITFQTISDTIILIIVHEGHLETGDGKIVEAGQAIFAELDDEGNIVRWGPQRSATPDELDLGNIVRGALIELSDEPPVNTGEGCGPGVTHTVAVGENLFRIAQRYGTSVSAITQANGIGSSNVIFAGQQLVIPCGVDTGLPSNAPLLISTPSVGGVGCTRFRATSPLDGMRYGDTTFYWDPAPGATGYRVVIYNFDVAGGNQVAAFETTGDKTNLTVSITNETVGLGFDFAWEVQAMFNGQVACTSARSSMQREAQPPPPDQPDSPTTCPPAAPSCNFNYTCEACLGETVGVCPSDCP